MITIFGMRGLIRMALLRDRFPFPHRFPSSIFTLFAPFHRFRRHVLHGSMVSFVHVALFVLLHVGCHRCGVGSEWKGRFSGWVVLRGMGNLWSWCVGGFFVAGGDPSYVVKNDSGRDTEERSPRGTSVWGRVERRCFSPVGSFHDTKLRAHRRSGGTIETCNARPKQTSSTVQTPSMKDKQKKTYNP